MDSLSGYAVTFGDLAVAVSAARKDLTLDLHGGGTETLLATLNFAQDFGVGQNPFVLTLHKKADMHGMVWTAINDAAITITPSMPTMGHGSPDNIDPAFTADGLYEGSVNFTMGGVWEVWFEASSPLGNGTMTYELEI